MTAIDVVVPMAGEGTRFARAGWPVWKPLIDVRGRTMIERVLDDLRLADARYVLLVRADRRAEAEPVLHRALEGREHAIVWIDRPTEGAACTVLWARRLIDGDRPLLLANSDQIVDVDLAEYVADAARRGLDGSILTFPCPERDRKWSFVRLDEREHVVEVREKVAISERATVGIYLFARGADFVRAAIDMIARNERVQGEFYVCPVYNQAIASGLDIGIFDIPRTAMHGTGTPDDLAAYCAHLEAAACTR